ncbi:MAG: hypothetical protein QGF59_04365, partial [Pirellulaceae bacterium]|nr:hypothetical protein [Pirellulaceae bacterium]
EFICNLGTNFPGEHVATIESVVALLHTVIAALLPIGGGGPGGPAEIALTAALNAGGAALLPVMSGALATGLQVAATLAKPPVPAVPGVQLTPGLGAVLFKVG